MARRKIANVASKFTMLLRYFDCIPLVYKTKSHRTKTSDAEKKTTRYFTWSVIIRSHDLLSKRSKEGTGKEEGEDRKKKQHGQSTSAAAAYRKHRPVWFCILGSIMKLWPLITVLNKVSLQNQLQNSALGTLKNLMRPLTALEDSYYSITVVNHRLITVIRFVAKSYTRP